MLGGCFNRRGVSCCIPDYEYTEYVGPHSFSNGVCTHCGLHGGYCGIALVWVLDEESGTLTISGGGSMYYYSNLSPWYSKRNSITAVIIENGVTSIGNNAFDDCYATIEEGQILYAFCDFDKSGFVDSADYEIFEEMDKQTLDLLLFDFDGDGEITDFDSTIVKLFAFRHIGFNLMADANYDGLSNIIDLVSIKKLIAVTTDEGRSDLNLDGKGDAEDAVFARKFILVIPPEWREIEIK